MLNYFFCPLVNAVHPARPLLLVGNFQDFRDTLLLHHGFFNDFQPLPAGIVAPRLGKQGGQLVRLQIVVVSGLSHLRRWCYSLVLPYWGP